MSIRGVISHRARAKQLNDFRNLRFERNITPTDIDGFLDFDNKLFVWFELKYRDAGTFGTGQRKALERMCDAAVASGRRAFVILAVHQVEDTNEDVDVAICIVHSIYYHQGGKGKWHPQPGEPTVKESIDKMFNRPQKQPLVFLCINENCTQPAEANGYCELCNAAEHAWP